MGLSSRTRYQMGVHPTLNDICFHSLSLSWHVPSLSFFRHRSDDEDGGVSVAKRKAEDGDGRQAKAPKREVARP